MPLHPSTLLLASALAVFCGTAASRAFEAADAVPFPRGFREWALVKSAVILEGYPSFAANGGIHHIYANPAALAGYRSGTFDDGAAIAAEFVFMREENKMLVEGARRRVDVMLRDRTRYAATGGWGFESYAGEGEDKPTVRDKATAMCFECHSKQTKTSFVFSTLRP